MNWLDVVGISVSTAALFCFYHSGGVIGTTNRADSDNNNDQQTK